MRLIEQERLPDFRNLQARLTVVALGALAAMDANARFTVLMPAALTPEHVDTLAGQIFRRPAGLTHDPLSVMVDRARLDRDRTRSLPSRAGGCNISL